jgi:hypothetical protein
VSSLVVMVKDPGFQQSTCDRARRYQVYLQTMSPPDTESARQISEQDAKTLGEPCLGSSAGVPVQKYIDQSNLQALRGSGAAESFDWL